MLNQVKFEQFKPGGYGGTWIHSFARICCRIIQAEGNGWQTRLSDNLEDYIQTSTLT
jgi:hypothetical protein